MSDEHRAFRGVWIPASLWLNTELSLQEKVMLVEIDSLQHPERGCWKSNKKFGEFFHLSANRISEIVSSLAKKGWINVEQIRDGKQCVERRIFMAAPLEKPNTPTRDSEGGYSENGENPTRDSEGGYSENREERGSGLGVQGEGASKSPAPGDEPPAPEVIQGELVPAEHPRPEPEAEPAEDPKPRCEIPADMPGPKDPSAKTYKAWANYAMAYRHRYDTWPIWNAKNAGLVSQLVDRVGADMAPAVAAYYLKINQTFYVTKLHPLGNLVADCESIATQMVTNRQMTTSQARQADSTQGNLSGLDEAKRLMREKREREGRVANGS